jgi:hypothetical protein
VAAGFQNANAPDRLPFVLTVLANPSTLPAGRYWMMVALGADAQLWHDVGQPTIPFRAVDYTVDINALPPERLGKGSGVTVTPSMRTRPNYYLLIQPQ